MTFQELVEQVRALSSEELMKLADVVQSLQQAETVNPRVGKRILGLGKEMGYFWIAPDFDDPIFPEDWMDDPADPLNWKNNAKNSDK